jgi:hypothetical protein
MKSRRPITQSPRRRGEQGGRNFQAEHLGRLENGRRLSVEAKPFGLQPGNEDVALETLIQPELLFAAGQVR